MHTIEQVDTHTTTSMISI